MSDNLCSNEQNPTLYILVIESFSMVFSMKNLTLIFSALLCVLSACGNGSNGVASLKLENGEESEDEPRSSDNRDNLGTCSPKKEGRTVIDEKEGIMYRCKSGDWQEFAKVILFDEDLPSCNRKRDGLLYYIQDEEKTFVCDDMDWKNYEVDAVSSSSQGTQSSSHITTSSTSISSSGSYNGPGISQLADKTVAEFVYNSWHDYHFVTMNDESAYYPSIASDFRYVFNGYSPVGRVKWTQMSSGSYSGVCSVDDAVEPAMKFRACTVSEGIGYGMLLSYFQEDKATFDALWNYSRGYRSYFSTPLTPWITSSFNYTRIDVSSTTDADLDIATALILMYYKTGTQEYLNDAIQIVNAIWETEIEKTNLLILPGNSSMWQNDLTFNLSYFSPVALRLFEQIDSNHNWTGVLDAMYTYMKMVQDGGTGVFPDWSDISGIAKKSPNGSSNNSYWLFDKESVRIPWRIAWDYYWFQDERAKAILDKLNEFIVRNSSGNPTSVALGVGYSWNLSVGNDKTGGGTISNQWLAAWCATGISGNTTWLNACVSEVNNRMLSNNGSSYYSDILFAVYSQLLNGMYVRPF